MRGIKSAVIEDAAAAGWGLSVLLASPHAAGGKTAQGLLRLGVQVAVEAELYDAMALLLDDPREADLLVIDCDGYGGLAAGQRAFAILNDAKVRLPVMLISEQCHEQIFPLDRTAPYVLRAPVSTVALRVGFESAFHLTPDQSEGWIRSALPH